MIFIVTDFGLQGPYTGQVKAVLAQRAAGVPVIDLFADLPPFRPMGAAYLLAAYAQDYPKGSVFLGVVDPGVGSDRPAVALDLDGRWFVGPGNGLFEICARRAASVRSFHLAPEEGSRISASFHGRDLFAPAAAALAMGDSSHVVPAPAERRPDWPDDLAEIVYCDRFGNLMTGLRASVVPKGAALIVKGHRLNGARTFADVPTGRAFWYENANGLVEIAVNQGRAVDVLALGIGEKVLID